MSDRERIEQSADDMLTALETPIAGVPSVRIIRRENAKRLLVAALTAIWEAANVEDGQ